MRETWWQPHATPHNAPYVQKEQRLRHYFCNRSAADIPGPPTHQPCVVRFRVRDEPKRCPSESPPVCDPETSARSDSPPLCHGLLSNA